jgi:antitoxin CptB
MRSSEGLDDRRKRLLYRCWHRGMREMDFLMGYFADAHLEDMSEKDLSVFEQYLDVPDRELLGWITGEIPVPATHDTDLFYKWRSFIDNKPVFRV